LRDQVCYAHACQKNLHHSYCAALSGGAVLFGPTYDNALLILDYVGSPSIKVAGREISGGQSDILYIIEKRGVIEVLGPGRLVVMAFAFEWPPV
jgi:hypothetical protein